jgi:hypothetical protein
MPSDLDSLNLAHLLGPPIQNLSLKKSADLGISSSFLVKKKHEAEYSQVAINTLPPPYFLTNFYKTTTIPRFIK